MDKDNNNKSVTEGIKDIVKEELRTHMSTHKMHEYHMSPDAVKILAREELGTHEKKYCHRTLEDSNRTIDNHLSNHKIDDYHMVPGAVRTIVKEELKNITDVPATQPANNQVDAHLHMSVEQVEGLITKMLDSRFMTQRTLSHVPPVCIPASLNPAEIKDMCTKLVDAKGTTLQLALNNMLEGHRSMDCHASVKAIEQFIDIKLDEHRKDSKHPTEKEVQKIASDRSSMDILHHTRAAPHHTVKEMRMQIKKCETERIRGAKIDLAIMDDLEPPDWWEYYRNPYTSVPPKPADIRIQWTTERFHLILKVVEHWRLVYLGKEEPNQIMCSFCAAYQTNSEFTRCDGCPIFIVTGKRDCKGTSYQKAWDEYRANVDTLCGPVITTERKKMYYWLVQHLLLNPVKYVQLSPPVPQQCAPAV